MRLRANRHDNLKRCFRLLLHANNIIFNIFSLVCSIFLTVIVEQCVLKVSHNTSGKLQGEKMKPRRRYKKLQFHKWPLEADSKSKPVPMEMCYALGSTPSSPLHKVTSVSKIPRWRRKNSLKNEVQQSMDVCQMK